MEGKLIRKKLSEILLQDKSLHASLVKRLKQKMSESGDVLDCEIYKGYEDLSYGVCHNFTLDFNQSIHAYSIGDDIHDCTAFRRLVKADLIEKEESLLNADIVVYLRSTASFPAHIHSGKVVDGKIISRWGSGNIWIHDQYQVPSFYELGDGSISTLLFKIRNTQDVHNFLSSEM